MKFLERPVPAVNRSKVYGKNPKPDRRDTTEITGKRKSPYISKHLNSASSLRLHFRVIYLSFILVKDP